MNAKDKAIEIAKQYCLAMGSQNYPTAIKCAIIHVKGIIEVLDIFPRYQMTPSEIERLDYWNEVLTILKGM